MLAALASHPARGDAPATSPAHTVRLAAAQPKARLIDWRLKNPDAVLARVDQSLTELESLVDQAAAQHCDALALPEDTLGLGTWEAGNENFPRDVRRRPVDHMHRRHRA
jgi:hypothetical protein